MMVVLGRQIEIIRPDRVAGLITVPQRSRHRRGCWSDGLYEGFPGNIPNLLLAVSPRIR
jgi:hypothetical protein